MKIGIISGTGFYDFPEMESVRERRVLTEFGDIPVTEGVLAGTPVVHICRHGKGHQILSHQVNHLGNVSAFAHLGVDCIIGTTVGGVVQPTLELGKLFIFSDLYFPENRLPGGEPCTIFTKVGDRERGHLISDVPFSRSLRAEILKAVGSLGCDHYGTGVYGHVNGPRFNTKPEITVLAKAGVSVVSQTAGPEIVLAAELEIPYQLIGFGVDYANGVTIEPTPVALLKENMEQSTSYFKSVIAATVKHMTRVSFDQGIVYRFE
jgi:5'-methylthioadenosine phosphorylase